MVNLLWLVAAIVVARVDVGVLSVIVAESVRGGQRVFHDEILKKSLFFGTMCVRCSRSNVAVGGTDCPSTKSRLTSHTNTDISIFYPCRHQYAEVHEVPSHSCAPHFLPAATAFSCLSKSFILWSCCCTLNCTTSVFRLVVYPANISIHSRSPSCRGARAPLIAAIAAFASDESCRGGATGVTVFTGACTTVRAEDVADLSACSHRFFFESVELLEFSTPGLLQPGSSICHGSCADSSFVPGVAGSERIGPMPLQARPLPNFPEHVRPVWANAASSQCRFRPDKQVRPVWANAASGQTAPHRPHV